VNHPDALRPLEPALFQGLRDVVHARLRAAILAGELAGNARLSERAIALGLGISTTPVKEALRRLESEGLVVTMPRRGTFVSSFTVERIAEMAQIRMALECVSARLAAAKATTTQIRRLERQLGEMRRLTEKSDGEALIGANEAFHDQIHTIASNPYLSQLVLILRAYDLAARRRILARKDELARALAEHQAILAAIRARDSDAAEAAMRAHVARSAGLLDPASAPA
jgi:DNA-binding GntR family transcriptional regulator